MNEHLLDTRENVFEELKAHPSFSQQALGGLPSSSLVVGTTVAG